MSKSRDWLVSVDLDASFESIVKSLKEHGFEVSHALSEVGCITGKGSSALVKKLRDIPGVIDISEDFPVEIPERIDDPKDR